MRFCTRLIAAAGMLAAFVFLSAEANAALYRSGDAGFPSVTTNPSNWTDAVYSDESNSDVGNQSPANVETVLESMAWFGQSLSFVGGGACGASPAYNNNCTQFDNGGGNSNKGGISNLTAAVFAVHFGNRFIAFMFDQPVNGFEVLGLRYDVSNIYAFNADSAPTVPLPAAAWLMLAGVAGLGFAGRKTKKR